jgi:uncharacterized membrane protein
MKLSEFIIRSIGIMLFSLLLLSMAAMVIIPLCLSIFLWKSVVAFFIFLFLGFVMIVFMWALIMSEKDNLL